MSAAYASRFEAAFLCSHPKRPKISSAATSRYMGKSISFVKKWVKRYNDVKNVDDMPECDMHHSTSEKNNKAILKILCEESWMFSTKSQVTFIEKGCRSKSEYYSITRCQYYGWRHKVKIVFERQTCQKTSIVSDD